MAQTGVVSPIPGWVKAGGELPEITRDGLSGVDPANGLAFVNLGHVPVKLRPSCEDLFLTQGGASVVYFFGLVNRVSTSLIPQKRFLLISCDTLYLLYTDCKVARCIPLTNITSLATTPDKYIGVSVDKEHDLAFRVETQSDLKRVEHVIATLYKGPPPLKKVKYQSKDVLKMTMKLVRKPGWEVVMKPLVAVTEEQLKSQARRVQTPSPPPPAELLRVKSGETAETCLAATPVNLDDLPDVERQRNAKSERKNEKLLAQRGRNKSTVEGLLQNLEEVKRKLAKAEAEREGSTADRKKLRQILNIAQNDDLRSCVGQKLSVLNKAKTDWKAQIKEMEDEVVNAKKQIEQVDLPGLEAELEEATKIDGETWDLHLSMANEIQDLVMKIDGMTATTDEINTQIDVARQVHDEDMRRLKAKHDDRLTDLKGKIAALQVKLSTPPDPSPYAARSDLLTEKIALATQRRDALRTSVHKLKRQLSMYPSQQPPTPTHTLTPPTTPIDEAQLAEELRDASEQLQVAMQRIHHLQSVVDEAPTIAHRLELKEAEKQKLDFEARELLIKGKAMKQEFESKMTDLKMKIETVGLKVGQLEHALGEQEEGSTRDVEAARKKFVREAAMIRKEEELEREKVSSAKRDAQKAAAELENYYLNKARNPDQDSSIEDMEAKLICIDNSIEAVQRELGLLSERDLSIREKFEKSEQRMKSEEHALRNKMTLWHPIEDRALVEDAKLQMDKLTAQRKSLQESMDAFALQARNARDRHHKREKDLMGERDSLLRAIASAQETRYSLYSLSVSPMSKASPTSPQGPHAPAWITTVTITRAPNEKWGLSCNGVMVSTVVPGSPVDRAGLRVGQQVLTVNDVQVHTKEQIYAAFSSETSVKAVLHE